MSLRICSLTNDEPQAVPADGEYHLLRFPYGGGSYDPWNMHAPEQPDGGRSQHPDARSALVRPAAAGRGRSPR